jgi:hypothetical protein
LEGQKVKRFVATLIAIALIFSLSTLYSQDSNDSEGWKTLIVSKDGKEREKARRLVMQKYAETRDYLRSLLRKPVTPGEPFFVSTPRNIAMKLLGKLRAKGAIPELMNWLLPKKGQSVDRTEFLKYGSAGYALIEIGLPAVPHLLAKVKKEAADRLGQECMKVIRDIKGKEEAILLLKTQIEKEKDKKVKQNLQAGLEYLKKLK